MGDPDDIISGDIRPGDISPDDIVPDDKDWTWVLDRPCPECGFESGSVDVADIGALIRSVAARWPAVLERHDVRARPLPGTWSPLEYACHVRDVFELYDQRLALMLAEDDPLFANWDQDATAVTDRYADADPATVSAQLVAAADAVAARFQTVRGDDWQRRGRRSDGAAFTIESFARYFVHDPIHHLVDVGA